jgi:4-amino-4-deoxy-L-arabinose transferase-like glycosyltransferase
VPPRPSDRAIILGLLLLNFVLKFSWLGVNELAGDEPFTVYWSQRPLGELFAMLRTENNPPLYFLLVKAWSHLVPFSAAWLRVPSAVFSALAVWPLFRLGERSGGRLVGVIAALLFTFSNYHYGFAHEVRAYALFTLLATTGMWLLVRAVDKPDNGRNTMLGLAALNVVLVYTHFFGWLAIGVQLLCVFEVPELRALRRRSLLGLVIPVACYLPYAAIFFERAGTSVTQGTWVEVPPLEELYNMVWRWSNAPVLAVLFLAMIIIGSWRSTAHKLGRRLAVLWTFVPLMSMFVVSQWVPMFLDRYLVYAAPGFCLLVALTLKVVVQDQRVSLGLSALAVLGMCVTFTPWKETARHPSHVVEQVEALCEGECSINVIPRWYWLNYQAGYDLLSLRKDLSPLLRGEEERMGVPEAQVESAIVVDAGSELVDPRRAWFNELRVKYPAVDSVEADHRVWVYRFHR